MLMMCFGFVHCPRGIFGFDERWIPQKHPLDTLECLTYVHS